MHPKLHHLLVAASAGSILSLLVACSGSSSGSGSPGSSDPSITVSVTGSATVALGSTAQYAASVAGSSNHAVTWTVNQNGSGNAQVGTISATGLYVAPTTMPSSSAIVIAAVSAADSKVSGIVSVTLQPPAAATAVAVAGPATVSIGSAAQYSAVVASSSDQSVTWAVNGVAGGNASVGTIAASGLYTPPSTVPGNGAITITATSAITPSISGSMQVNVLLAVATTTAAARFLDQATFGPTAATIAHVQQIGLPAALTEQFNQPTTPYTQPPSPATECGSSNWHCSQSDFVKISAWGNDQLRQRVAMALGELWVAPMQYDNAMPFYLNTLANDAFTNYRTIMQDVTLSPQMGNYLNMVGSGAAPAGEIVNENYAREIMQLFCLGLNLLNSDGTAQTDGSGNTIPTFSELQVDAFARAYTGWTYANPDGSTPQNFIWTPTWNHPMVPIEHRHDMTQKILLNGTTLPAGQSAEQDLKGALDNIFAHPNIGPFVSRQLIQHLVTGNPSPGYVQRVAAVFANNGSGVRGDMKAVITAILMDQEARAGDAQTGDQAESSPAVDGGHLREPLLWTMNLIRALNAKQTNPSDPYPFITFVTQPLSYMQEQPFNQTDVFNFFSPEYTVPLTNINSPEFGLENTGAVIPRLNHANNFLNNLVPGITVDLSTTSTLGQEANDPVQLADYLSMLFMHSQMPTDMRSNLITAISGIPATDLQQRALVGVFLVVTSSQYKVMH